MLLQQVPVVRHMVRQKFIAQLVIGLIKSRNVQFCEVAQHLNDAVKVASNETRIQDFFREAEVNYSLLAHLLLTLLPATGKLRLCLDRTEWDFGHCQVNILLVTVGQGDFHVPLYWELLDNRSGNSSAADRMALLQVCVQVVGKDRIGLVLGDREFVGHAWLKWLKDNGLNFIYAPAQTPPPDACPWPAAGRGHVGPGRGAGAPLSPLSGRGHLGPGVGEGAGRWRVLVSLRQRGRGLYGPTLR